MNAKEIKNYQEFLLQLSRGTDPTSGLDFSTDSVLQNKIIRQRLFEVSALLDYIDAEMISTIEIGKLREVRPNKKISFSFFPNFSSLEKMEYPEFPISISRFTFLINERREETHLPKIKATMFTNWLINLGFLRYEHDEIGNSYKVATDLGNQLGISTELKRNSRMITYSLNLYNRAAIEFLLSKLPDILQQKYI